MAYTDETYQKAIDDFQQKLKDADNLQKDKYGNLDFESCWKALRTEGPTILNVTKHLFSLHINRNNQKKEKEGNGE
jgi:hypothetical protein